MKSLIVPLTSCSLQKSMLAERRLFGPGSRSGSERVLGFCGGNVLRPPLVASWSGFSRKIGVGPSASPRPSGQGACLPGQVERSALPILLPACLKPASSGHPAPTRPIILGRRGSLRRYSWARARWNGMRRSAADPEAYQRAREGALLRRWRKQSFVGAPEPRANESSRMDNPALHRDNFACDRHHGFCGLEPMARTNSSRVEASMVKPLRTQHSAKIGSTNYR
jgi:hypothetical protein